MAGVFADVVATSFYPAKPLGCYGDGGAVQTNDPELMAVMRSLSVHGQGEDRYDNVRVGMTARLDTFQAAVPHPSTGAGGHHAVQGAADELDARSRIAARYTQALGIARPQVMASDVVSTWAQYTIRIADGGREAFMAGMRAAGIPTVIYYQRPLHGQTAYRAHPIEGGHLPVTEMLCREVVSLPMHAYLDASVQDRIIETALHLLGGRNAAAA